jgi:hypothetical protein
VTGTHLSWVWQLQFM